MSAQAAVVDALAAKGIQVGPPADAECRQCHHRWGGHLLHAVFDSPLQGGTTSCLEEGCTCFATWSAPSLPDALRKTLDDRALRKHE